MIRIAGILFAFLLIAGPASGAATPEQKCESSKNKAAGKYAQCRSKAQAKAVTKGIPPDYTKCDEKYAKSWQKAEAKAAKKGAVCPTDGDEVLMQSLLVEQSDTVATALGGAGVPGCGDAAVNVVGEECDGLDLAGRDCVNLGHFLGDLACDGSCRFDTSGCSPCPGVTAGGFCFVLGSAGDSCDDACAAEGLVYDGDGTVGYTGSDGTNENCEAVLDALGANGSGAPTNPSCADAFGCATDTGTTRVRCLEPTTSTAVNAVVIRVCACQ